jgi:hypothetical protein
VRRFTDNVALIRQRHTREDRPVLRPVPDVAADQSPTSPPVTPLPVPDIAADQSANVAAPRWTDQSSTSPDVAADQSTSPPTQSSWSPDIAADQSANVATHGWTDRSRPVP